MVVVEVVILLMEVLILLLLEGQYYLLAFWQNLVSTIATQQQPMTKYVQKVIVMKIPIIISMNILLMMTKKAMKIVKRVKEMMKETRII